MNLLKYACLSAALATVCLSLPQAHGKLSGPKLLLQGGWRELSSPHYIWPTGGAIYYSFSAKNGSRVHLVVVNLKSGRFSIRPALSATTAPVSEIALKEGASAAVNGGFFNLSDGVSASYVNIDGKETANPRTNQALTGNPRLIPFLETIFNRSEIRFLQDSKGVSSIEIAAHNAPVPANSKLVHCLQAGPRLLPQLNDWQEAFLRKEPDGKEADSIGVKKEAARTAFGITPDGYAMLLAVCGNGQDNSSPGLTLAALSDLLKGLGCTQAINLDGGASSTMFVRLSPVNTEQGTTLPPGSVVCGKSPETRVKSILMIQPLRK